MPEISLLAYESQINQSIDQARYLEALAHTRHILSQYPRYVGAYYLLGKTMFEADLPDLATDMFRRALSADPEHLMSRIGLGLAHERRGDLNAAIWNLERALELDPGNSDIAEELRRMYGRRDAVEPEYVPQTRAGLARLYLRGHRFGRAVEELQTLLADDAARPDLLTALAEAHWRDSQLVQAAEVCQEILDKMPYNLKANLLLGTLWVNSGQEEGWLYLNRAEEVDLENRLADELFGADSLLEPREVELDRLVYDPDAIDVDRSSTWFRRLEAASITVGISEAPPEMTDSEVRLVDITAGLESQIEIPDWLRELGAPEVEEGEGELGWMAEIAFEEPAGPARLEEVPTEEAAVGSDWEPVVAPEIEEGLEQPPPEEVGEGIPDWATELMPPEAGVEEGEAEGVPEWLRGGASEEEAAADEAVADLEALLESSSEVPEWLAGLALEEEADVATTEEEGADLDWLRQLGIEEAPDVEEAGPAWPEESRLAFVEEEPEAGVEAESRDEGLDWLTESLAEVEAEGIDEEVLPADEMPDWLADLRPPDEVGEMAKPEAGKLTLAEEIPDWLTDLAPSETEAGVEEFELPEEGMPEWLAQLQEDAGEPVPAEATVAEPTLAAALDELEEEAIEEIPDWLRDFDTEGTVTVEAGPTSDVEDMPDWLRELEPEGMMPEVPVPPTHEEDVEPPVAAEPTTVVEPEAAEATLEVPEVTPEEAGVLSGEDALAWLESLAAGHEDELRAQAEVASAARVDEILGRRREEPPTTVVGEELRSELMELGEPEETPAVLAGEEAAISGDETLAWLESLAAEPAPSETLIESPQPATEEIAAAIEAPEEEGELLSGDDALAWFASLTAGKEEELRAQAEAESAARVDEILGRRRRLPAEEAEATVIEPTVPEEGLVELAAEPEVLEAADELLEEAKASVIEPTVPEEDLVAEPEVLEAADELLQEAEAAVIEPAVAEADLAEAAPEPGVLEAADELLQEVETAAIEPSVAEEDLAEAALEPEAMEAADELPEEAEATVIEPTVVEEDLAEAALESEVTEAAAEQLLEEAEAVVVEPPGVEEQAFESGLAEAAGELLEEAAAPLETPDEEGGLLSGDEALAWLESLTVGKEEALRAQAEAESAARVDEILGRRRAPLVEMPPVEPAPAEAGMPESEAPPEPEAVIEPPAEAVEEKATAEPGAEPETAFEAGAPSYFGWSAFGEEPTEVAEAAPEPVTEPLPEEVVSEDMVAEERELPSAPSGEDALAWLEGLAPEKEASLRAQVEGEPAVGVAPAPEAEPEEPARLASMALTEKAAVDTEEPAEPGEEEPLLIEAPVDDGALPQPEAEPQVEPVSAQSEAPAPVSSDEAGVEGVEPVPVTAQAEAPTPAGAEAGAQPAAVPQTVEPAAAAEAELDLDALRARVKQKRSDHASRLTLARGLWNTGEIPEAMEHYGRLIKAGAKAEDVLADLRHYVEEQPSEPRVLRTMGDILMKNGELDEALAIYNRAMELL